MPMSRYTRRWAALRATRRHEQNPVTGLMSHSGQFSPVIGPRKYDRFQRCEVEH